MTGSPKFDPDRLPVTVWPARAATTSGRRAIDAAATDDRESATTLPEASTTTAWAPVRAA